MNVAKQKEFRRTVKHPRNNKALGQLNRNMVLRQIITGEAKSQAELSRNLNINKGTICSIVAELKSMGLIEEIGLGESTKLGGCKPINLAVSENSAYIIGLWLDGAREGEICLLNLKGKIVKCRTFSLPEYSMENLPEFLCNTINKWRAECLREFQNAYILATGVAIGGLVDPWDGSIRRSLYLSMKNVPLRQILETQTGIPTFVEDSSVVAALREHWLGEAKGAENFVFLRVLPFIRAVIFVNGEVYYGNQGFAGQVGLSLLHLGFGKTKLVSDLIDHDIFGLETSPEAPASLTSRHEQVSHFERIEEFIYRIQKNELTADEYDKLFMAVSEVVSNLLVFNDPELIIVDGISQNYQSIFIEKTREIISKQFSDLFTGTRDIRCSISPEEHKQEGIVCMVLTRMSKKKLLSK